MPEGGRLRLFDAVGAFLTAASSEGPNPRRAGRPARGGRAVAVATALPGGRAGRGEDSARGVLPGGRQARARAADVFAELARVGRRIPLRGLAPADIEAYVATVTESTASRRAVARLHEVTGGNPFFLGEVVRLLAAGDTLASLDERTGDPLLRIPEEVRALIRRRVAALPREAVATLRLAAVIGRKSPASAPPREPGAVPSAWRPCSRRRPPSA